MTITPIGTDPASTAAIAGGNLAQTATRGGSENISVSFSPAGERTGPLDQVGSSMVSKLKGLEAARADRSSAMSGMQAGPASPIDTAKAQLLDGPASRSLSTQSMSMTASSGGETDMAMSAMTRTFDYAIETQLIVKTGSQLSTSASSLMRGQ